MLLEEDIDLAEPDPVNNKGESVSTGTAGPRSLDDEWHQAIKQAGIDRQLTDGHGFNRPMNYLTRFNSMGKTIGLDIHTANNGFMAITRPCCNLVQENISADEVFSMMQYTDEGCMLLNNLTAVNKATKGSLLIQNDIGPSPFVTFLSSQVLNVSGMKDVIVEKYENDGDLLGNRQSLFAGIQESKSLGEVTVTYQDDINLNILMFHHLWIKYMDRVASGVFSPEQYYMRKKILDYVSSMYIIILKPDGMSISAMYKMTGLFPINAPWGNIGLSPGEKGDGKTTITYAYSHLERMEPSILFDFNTIVQSAFTYNESVFRQWFSTRVTDEEGLDDYESQMNHPTYTMTELYGGSDVGGTEEYYTMTGENKHLGHPFIDRTGKFGFRKF